MREKVYFGSRGGEYYVRFGKKLYLSSFGAESKANQSMRGRNKPKKPAHNCKEELETVRRKEAGCQSALVRSTTRLGNATRELDEVKRRLTYSNKTIDMLRNKHKICPREPPLRFDFGGNPTRDQLLRQGSNRKERKIYAVSLAKQLAESQRQLTNCTAQLNTSRRQTRVVTQERNDCREQLAEMRIPPRYSSAAAGPSTAPPVTYASPELLAIIAEEEAQPGYEPPTYGGLTLAQIHQKDVALAARARGDHFNIEHIPSMYRFGRRRR